MKLTFSSNWCASRHVNKLNADKTEVILFDSRANLAKLSDQLDCTLQVTSGTIQPISVWSTLACYWTQNMSQKQYKRRQPLASIAYAVCAKFGGGLARISQHDWSWPS